MVLPDCSSLIFCKQKKIRSTRKDSFYFDKLGKIKENKYKKDKRLKKY